MTRHEIANHIDLLLGRIGCQEPVEEIRKHHIEDAIDAILADSESDLAAAQERLEEMCRALESVRDYHLELGEHTQTLNDAISTLWKIGEIAEEALSAAPAGQVVWREMVVGTTEGVRDEELTKFDGPSGTLWVTEWLLDDDQNGAEFILTIYQTTPEAEGGE